VYGLARDAGGRLGYLILAFGGATSLSGCGVGLLPLDRFVPHLVAASLLFCGWPCTVALVTLAVRRAGALGGSRVMLAAGVLTLVPAVIFLAMPKREAIEALLNIGAFQRPGFWAVAFVEWLLLFSMIGWLTAASVALWRSAAARECSRVPALDAGEVPLPAAAVTAPPAPRRAA
jgi:hypothetical protein